MLSAHGEADRVGLGGVNNVTYIYVSCVYTQSFFL